MKSNVCLAMGCFAICGGELAAKSTQSARGCYAVTVGRGTGCDVEISSAHPLLMLERRLTCAQHVFLFSSRE